MCGIYAHIYNQNSTLAVDHKFNIRTRGPDNVNDINVSPNVNFTFFRLKINDLSDNGNQPLSYNNVSLICNGEIYNSEKLKKEFDVEWQSSSDCEVLLHMYIRYGFKEMCNKIDGVFAIVLYDHISKIVYIGRDPFGVRPMFFADNDFSDIEVASEIKSIHPSLRVSQFPPGHCLTIHSETLKCTEPERYFFMQKLPIVSYSFACSQVKETLVSAVQKRLMSDRPIGCLLSGGLDSSLISAIVAREFKKQNKETLNTFSIGFPGSTDLGYARQVAEYIGSHHHEILLTEKEFIEAIPNVIKAIESYDTTTVRASVGNYLVSKYIKENTNITVVFNGDGSDEVAGGYLYLKNAPTDGDFHNESLELLNNIHFFDVLRSDRALSSDWSLEARTPFLDKAFVNTYLNVPVEFRVQSYCGIEKSLLRNAFKEDNLLPNSVLFRTKEAFSDGVSGTQNSWHKVIQQFVDSQVSDEEFISQKERIVHNPPLLKESYYYRKVFESFYPNKAGIIPKFWMPKWTKTIDPSAREL